MNFSTTGTVVPARFRLQYQKALANALYDKIGTALNNHRSAVNRNDYEQAEKYAEKILAAAEDFIAMSRGYKVWPELPTGFKK